MADENEDIETEEQEQEEKPAPKPKPKVKAKGPSLAVRVEEIISQHGDPNAALRVILAERDNYKTELDKVKSQVPGKGFVVLSPEEAAELATYRGFGKPADLRKSLAEGVTAKGEVETYRAERHVATIAELPAYGWNPKVLADITKGQKIEVRDTKNDAKEDIKLAYVLTVDKDGKEVATELGAHIKAEKSHYLPALKPSKAEGDGEGRRQRMTPAAGKGSPPPPPQKREKTEENGKPQERLATWG